MTMDVRKTPDAMIFALVAANNQTLLDNIASNFHLAETSTTNAFDYRNPTVSPLQVTNANATDTATAVVLVNEIKDVVDTHFADAIAHDTATSAAVTIADATDEATAITLANNLKSVYNTHLTASNVHYTNDGTNDVTNANATDASTLNTLINEIKGDVNAHIQGAPGGVYINLVNA